MSADNTTLQEAVLRDRYYIRKDGQPAEHSWEEVCRRVADSVGSEEPKWVREEFYELLLSKRFIPGGRILAAMGAPYWVTAYNCFVLPSPADSRGGILDSLRLWIEIQAKGGGVGINMSSLRPSGSLINGVNGTSSGPLAWMELFSTATHKVIQQGGSRRGAAMLVLDDSHPDILEFIKAKETPGLLEGANLSVNVSDKLMTAVSENGVWDLMWDGHLVQTINARLLWDHITGSAWASGEPGVVFLERAQYESNSKYFEDFVATNPCAEQPLGAHAVCLLGAVNLPAHVTQGRLDRTKLETTVGIATRFLDNVIDRTYYPTHESELVQKNIRRMGLGTMGLADMLVEIGQIYGSPEAITTTEEVFRSIKNAAYLASINLAKEKGSFPNYTKEYLGGEFIKRLSPTVRHGIESYGIRNCFLTSQAPTGSIAKLANVWAGIEPFYEQDTVIVNRLGTFTYSAPISPYTKFASEVSPEEHIAMQAAAQRHIDSAVSKTVNAPNSQRVEDTQEVYRLAYSQGLKSVAYYRDGSRNAQVQYRVQPNEQPEAISECDLASPGQCD